VINPSAIKSFTQVVDTRKKTQNNKETAHISQDLNAENARWAKTDHFGDS